MISNYPDREDKYEDYSKFGDNEKEVARIGLSYSPPFVIIIHANEEVKRWAEAARLEFGLHGYFVARKE